MKLAKPLTREHIETAMRMTHSNKAAARYLRVSYPHYKMYAKLYKEDGSDRTLFEAHKNQAGKGIPKFLLNKGKEPALMDLIEGRVPVEHFDPQKIKLKIIYEGLVEEKCGRCGFHERRVIDSRVPLILHHKDGDRKNFHLDNLEFLCYNCSFLYATSPITDAQVELMEDYVDKLKTEEVTWELDEYHIQHLKDLGLYEDRKDWQQYISKL